LNILSGKADDRGIEDAVSRPILYRTFSSQVSEVITQAVVLVMKIMIKKETEDEVVDFEYSPTTTIQQVREMAAGKMGCKATNLNVRKYTKAPVLANGKTFDELGITEEDMLSVAKTTRNLEKEGVKYASKQIMNGKTPSTKYQHLMNHAQKAHEENMTQHDVTHEQLDDLGK